MDRAQRENGAHASGECAGPDASLIAELLAGEGVHSVAQTMTGLFEAVAESWAGRRGFLRGGIPALLASSCFLVPRCGDRLLVWAVAGPAPAQVLSVLERADPGLAGELCVESRVEIEAASVVLRAGNVALRARELLTNADVHHLVEGTRSESIETRVCEVGHDVRRARSVSDEITGTFLQRAGAWFSTVLREARIHARATLFD